MAQLIEAEVNGVDRMIYMKSTSGGDGSYTLTVSFAVGSDPDLNTVNVNNRVNQAFARLPPEVQRNGVTVKKQSSALLQLIAVHSPKGSRDGQFLSNYATIDMLDMLRRVPGVGDATLFGPLDYAMRAGCRSIAWRASESRRTTSSRRSSRRTSRPPSGASAPRP